MQNSWNCIKIDGRLGTRGTNKVLYTLWRPLASRASMMLAAEAEPPQDVTAGDH